MTSILQIKQNAKKRGYEFVYMYRTGEGAVLHVNIFGNTWATWKEGENGGAVCQGSKSYPKWVPFFC
jgi:hypothetical protein